VFQHVEDDLGGVGRGAAVIAFRFHVQICVQVTDDHYAVGMLLFPAANFIDVSVGRQRAELAQIRRQHLLVGLFHDRQI